MSSCTNLEYIDRMEVSTEYIAYKREDLLKPREYHIWLCKVKMKDSSLYYMNHQELDTRTEELREKIYKFSPRLEQGYYL